MKMHAENINETPEVDGIPDASQARKVLVVEDEPHISRTLGRRLELSGMEPIMAVDATSAVQAARVHKPNLAILDIGLPGCDGFFVAEQLRELFTNDFPLIFLTANADPAVKERAKQFSPVAFLRKPYKSEVIMAVINSAL